MKHLHVLDAKWHKTLLKVKFHINMLFQLQDVCSCSETSCQNSIYGRYRYDSDLVNLHYIEVKMALAGVQ